MFFGGGAGGAFGPGSHMRRTARGLHRRAGGAVPFSFGAPIFSERGGGAGGGGGEAELGPRMRQLVQLLPLLVMLLFALLQIGGGGGGGGADDRLFTLQPEGPFTIQRTAPKGLIPTSEQYTRSVEVSAKTITYFVRPDFSQRIAHNRMWVQQVRCASARALTARHAAALSVESVCLTLINALQLMVVHSMRYAQSHRR